MLFESEICPLLLGLLLALRPLALDTELFCELVRAGAPHVVSKESAVSSLKAEDMPLPDFATLAWSDEHE